jgi:ParB family transcriptional regulator, chromosome partitioning protein
VERLLQLRKYRKLSKQEKATPELIQAEIDRIKEREKRAQELDAEKIQLTVHSLLTAFVTEPDNNTGLTSADLIGARLIIYQSLDYNARQKVYPVLFKGKKDYNSNERIYETISQLTDQQFAYLIRMALSSKSDSKCPRFEAGYFLYQMAKEAAFPVQTVETEQAAKAKERKEKQDKKILELKNRLKKLKKAA